MTKVTLAHLTLMQPPRVMIESAAGAGFDAAGVRICPRRPGDDYFVNLLGDRQEARNLRSLAADRGIGVSNVSAYQVYPDVTLDHLLPGVEITAELGCDCIVVNCFDGNQTRFDHLLAAYAEHAAQHGIRLALEFMPYSEIKSLNAALATISRVDARNVRLLLDALHLDRSGGTAENVSQLCEAHIAFAQVCDAQKLPADSSDKGLMWEARKARLPLGQGALNIKKFVSALPRDVEIEYEVAGLPGETPMDVAKLAKRNFEETVGLLGI